MKKIIFSIFLLHIFNCFSFAQEENDIRKMAVKMSMEMFKNKTDNLGEEVITEASYVPVSGEINPLLLKKQIDSLTASMSIAYDELSVIMEDKEVPIRRFIFKCKYYSFPDFRNVNVFLDGVQAEQNGNSIKISEDEYNKNVEEGIIQPASNYPGFPEIEHHVYLSDKYNPSEPSVVKGNLIISYPVHHETIEFSLLDIGKTKEFSGYKITLIAIDKNKVSFRVIGPRGFSDNVNKMLLNKDNHPFNFITAGSASYFLYEEGKKYNYNPDENQLTNMASRLSMDNSNIDDYSQITVSGTIAKVIFYKVVQMEEKSIPFSLIYKGD